MIGACRVIVWYEVLMRLCEVSMKFGRIVRTISHHLASSLRIYGIYILSEIALLQHRAGVLFKSRRAT
jgi:hypothetical protein